MLKKSLYFKKGLYAKKSLQSRILIDLEVSQVLVLQVAIELDIRNKAFVLSLFIELCIAGSISMGGFNEMKQRIRLRTL